jgi:hypothetical protein
MADHKRTRYPFEGWQTYFKSLDVALQHDLLRHARLPMDLFSHKSIALLADEFFRLWDALAIVKHDEPTLALRMIQGISAETLSPPMFATVSSENLNMALRRVSLYKPLVGPVRLRVDQYANETHAIFTGVLETDPLPLCWLS